MCATIGLLTMYILGTGLFGGLTYKFLKNKEKEFDKDSALKGMLVSYAIGLAIFMGMGTYFIIFRG